MPSMLDELMFCAAAPEEPTSSAAMKTMKTTVARTKRSTILFSTFFAWGIHPHALTPSRHFPSARGAPPPLAWPQALRSDVSRTERRSLGTSGEPLFPFVLTAASSPQVLDVDVVHLVDDLRERADGRLQARFGHDDGGVEIGVIEGVIDDVEARRVGIDDAELAAGTRLRPRINRDAERLEAVGDDCLQPIAAADEPPPRADRVRRHEAVADEVCLRL